MWARGLLTWADDEQQSTTDDLGDALAAFGLRLDGGSADPNEVYLWPDNEHTWGLWIRCQTQWRRAGMERQKVGLDYAGVQACMQLHAIPSEQQPQVFAFIQSMEVAALDEWQKTKG